MTISFKDILDIKKSVLTPFLTGRSGEGKTSYVKALAEHLEVSNGLTIFNLSAVEASDFTGLPYIDDKNLTRYARPAFLDSDMLFLDEMDMVRDNSVLAVLQSLLVDRKVNGHALKDTCILIGAGNGLSTELEEYDTKEFSTPMKKRLVEIPFSYSVDEKLAYLTSKYPNNSFIRFLEVKPELFETHDTRRLESFIQMDNISLCTYVLGKETARLYNHFIQENLVTLADIKRGEYDKAKLSPLTINSLIIDVVGSFYDLTEDDDCRNINKFISSLRSEEKSNYFSKLKKLCMSDTDKFKNQALALNTLGLFKGQKEYLAELVKITK